MPSFLPCINEPSIDLVQSYHAIVGCTWAVWIASVGSLIVRYDEGMPNKKREIATKSTRLFPSTYKIVSAIARARHTTILHVIDEWAHAQRKV